MIHMQIGVVLFDPIPGHLNMWKGRIGGFEMTGRHSPGVGGERIETYSSGQSVMDGLRILSGAGVFV